MQVVEKKWRKVLYKVTMLDNGQEFGCEFDFVIIPFSTLLCEHVLVQSLDSEPTFSAGF